jgi:hypothetical protein
MDKSELTKTIHYYQAEAQKHHDISKKFEGAAEAIELLIIAEQEKEKKEKEGEDGKLLPDVSK